MKTVLLLLCIISLASAEIVSDRYIVTWDANSEPDLAGYQIGYVRVTGADVDSGWVVDLGNTTETIIDSTILSYPRFYNKYLISVEFDCQFAGFR